MIPIEWIDASNGKTVQLAEHPRKLFIDPWSITAIEETGPWRNPLTKEAQMTARIYISHPVGDLCTFRVLGNWVILAADVARYKATVR